MTSSNTYYFTDVLRTVFTEQPVPGVGAQPTYKDIADFDDYWKVRLNYRIFFHNTNSICLGYEWTCSYRFI